MGVFWEALDEPVADADPVAEGESVADADPLADAVGEAAGEELLAGADGDPLAAELSLAEFEACPDADPPGEELEPGVIWTPPAIVEVTDTSLSAAAPRLMSTIRSGASEPLG